METLYLQAVQAAKAAETEEEFLLSNDAELEPAEVEAESLAGETAEEELSINNTEQDDSAFLLSNDAENQ